MTPRFFDTNILFNSICRELYSEDMAHGREVADTTIINPFR
jgi:predicted nucleic acid-binding protein